jgi:hypothetical protein
MLSFNQESDTVTISDDFDGSITMSLESFHHSVNRYIQSLYRGESVLGAHERDDITVTIEERDKKYYLSLESQGQKAKDISLEQWDSYVNAVRATNAVQWVTPDNVKTITSGMLSFEKIDNGRSVILGDKFGHATVFSWGQLNQVRDFIHKLGDSVNIEGKAVFFIEQDSITSKDTVRIAIEDREEDDDAFHYYFMLAKASDFANRIGCPNQGYQGKDDIGFSLQEWLEFANTVGLYDHILDKVKPAPWVA